MNDENKKITAINWNCHSIKGKEGELNKLVEMYRATIVTLQETWLDENDEHKNFINNMKLYRKDREKRGGGVAIGISKFIKSKPIKIKLQNSKIEIIARKLLLAEQKTLDIVSIYIPPDCKFNQNNIL
jgi:exonuclease III